MNALVSTPARRGFPRSLKVRPPHFSNKKIFSPRLRVSNPLLFLFHPESKISSRVPLRLLRLCGEAFLSDRAHRTGIALARHLPVDVVVLRLEQARLVGD